mgnify:CR=1 FL=1
MKDIFISLFFASIIVSCTSYDEMLDALESKQGINKLKKGMDYTKVEELAGEPYKKKFTNDNTEVWEAKPNRITRNRFKLKCSVQSNNKMYNCGISIPT